MTQENNTSYFDAQYTQEATSTTASTTPAIVPTVYPEIVQERAVAEYKPSRLERKIAGRADLAVQHEHHRAEIAGAVLQNTAMLARTASFLTEMAPEGEAIYRGIVQTYAMSAAARIQRW